MDELKKLMGLHKKHIKVLGDLTKEEIADEKNFYIIQRVVNESKELSLVIADFKCQKESCGATEKLSFHHLIMRKAKDFIPWNRYITSRHYWANIIILCWSCHLEYHNLVDQDGKKKTEISEAYINKIKKKYEGL